MSDPKSRRIPKPFWFAIPAVLMVVLAVILSVWLPYHREQVAIREKHTKTKRANDIATEAEATLKYVRQSVKDGTLTVEAVDGTELTEDEKVVWGTVISVLFQEALGKAIEAGIERLFERLEITGEIETKLMAKGLNHVDREALVSVYLFTNGDASKPPTTIELFGEGKLNFRLCRIHAPVQQPYAVVTETRIVNSKVSVVETVLVYDSTNGWISRKTTIVKRDLDGDDEEDALDSKKDQDKKSGVKD